MAADVVQQSSRLVHRLGLRTPVVGQRRTLGDRKKLAEELRTKEHGRQEPRRREQRRPLEGEQLGRSGQRRPVVGQRRPLGVRRRLAGELRRRVPRTWQQGRRVQRIGWRTRLRRTAGRQPGPVQMQFSRVEDPGSSRARLSGALTYEFHFEVRGKAR